MKNIISVSILSFLVAFVLVGCEKRVQLKTKTPKQPPCKYDAVELKNVSASDHIVKVILKYDEMASDYRNDFRVSIFDINNDRQKDILYTHQGSYGSCGYMWNILINKGHGKYVMSKYSILCTGLILNFSSKTYNGLRIPYFQGKRVTYMK